MNYSLNEENCMLNVSCSAMINEACNIHYNSETSDIMRNELIESSVYYILDLNQVEIYWFEFNATYEDLKISTRTSYSKSKLPYKFYTNDLFDLSVIIHCFEET